MILSPMNVELTKVHYNESFRKCRNQAIRAHDPPTISAACETIDNRININIRRNIFGQKSWTFSVNDPPASGSCKSKDVLSRVRLAAALCFLLAVGLSIAVGTVICVRNAQRHSKVIRPSSARPSRVIVFDQAEINVEKALQSTRQAHKERMRDLHAKQRQVEPSLDGTIAPRSGNSSLVPSICACASNQVCLRLPNGPLQCLDGKDARDPSGCKGLCALNTEHCRLLDRTLNVYECVENAQNGGGLRCPLGYFNCAGSLCLHETNKCDGRVDCADLSDEQNCLCDLEANFQCGNFTSCHEKKKKCDGKLDCWDNSDEVDCPAASACAPGALSCIAAGCFLPEQFCDGNRDCPDGSDEICQ